MICEFVIVYITIANSFYKGNEMLTVEQFAAKVAEKLQGTEDRYAQISAIQETILATDQSILATDRDTIDNILDVLFYQYGFNA